MPNKLVVVNKLVVLHGLVREWTLQALPGLTILNIESFLDVLNFLLYWPCNMAYPSVMLFVILGVLENLHIAISLMYSVLSVSDSFA